MDTHDCRLISAKVSSQSDFLTEKQRRKFRLLSFVTVYIFIYLQSKSADRSPPKFIAQNVRRQPFIY